MEPYWVWHRALFCRVPGKANQHSGQNQQLSSGDPRVCACNRSLRVGGIEVAHYLNNTSGSPVTLFRIFNGFNMLYHFKDIPSVFRQGHLFSLCVIIETHPLKFLAKLINICVSEAEKLYGKA